ncbi:MAG: hypothetical protein ACJAS1_000424 [Oleiphilaceae bacterium]|jgi:hypothetical protein
MYDNLTYQANNELRMKGTLKFSFMLFISLLFLHGCSSNPPQEIVEPPPAAAIATSKAVPTAGIEKVVPNAAPVKQIVTSPKKAKQVNTNKDIEPTPKPKATKTVQPKPVKAATPKPASSVTPTKAVKPKPKVQNIPETKSANTKATIKVQEKVIDSAVKTEIDVVKVVSETLAVDLAKLPMNIGTNWLLDRDKNGCELSYQTLKMEDGQGLTPVFLTIDGKTITFRTKSNIDFSYTLTGVTIDSEAQLPLEQLADDYSVSYQQHYQALLELMKTGKQATLTLGFWPTWPISRTYSVDFELSDLPSAYQSLVTCITLENELK